MKTRCEPGDRCIVVAELPGCECNVGAVLTVVDLGLAQTPSGPRPIWAFKDASRPLKITDVDDAGNVRPGANVVWTTTSAGFPRESRPGCFDHHLVPIAGEGELLLQRARELAAI